MTPDKIIFLSSPLQKLQSYNSKTTIFILCEKFPAYLTTPCCKTKSLKQRCMEVMGVIKYQFCEHRINIKRTKFSLELIQFDKNLL